MAGLRCIALGAALAGLLIAAGGNALAEAKMTPAQEQSIGVVFKDAARGRALFETGRIAEAEAVFRQVLARIDKDFPGDGPMRASGLHSLAAAVAERGDAGAAEPLAREALRLREADPARVGATAIAQSRALLGSILADLGRPREALALMKAAVDRMAADPNADRAGLIRAAAQLAGLMADQGDGQAAAALAGDLINLLPELAARPDLAVDVLAAAAHVQAVAGHDGEAESYYRRARERIDPTRPDAGERQAQMLGNIGSVLLDQGRAAEALPLLARASDELLRLHPDGSAATATALANYGEGLRATGALAEAFAAKRRALDLRLKLLPADHPLIATSFAGLGLDLIDDHRYAEARASLAKAVAGRQRLGDGIGTARAKLYLAVAERGLGNAAAADKLSAEALQALSLRLAPEHPLAGFAAVARAWLLVGAGRSAEALSVARIAAKALGARYARAETGDDRQLLPTPERRGIVVLVAAAWDVAATLPAAKSKP